MGCFCSKTYGLDLKPIEKSHRLKRKVQRSIWAKPNPRFNEISHRSLAFGRISA